MDAFLQNGDYVSNHQGTPLMVDGHEAWAQRVMLRLAVRRGSVPGAPKLGSRLHKLKGSGSREKLEQQALAAVREALAPMPDISVRAVRCMYKPQLQRLLVNVDLQAQGKALSLEVKL